MIADIEKSHIIHEIVIEKQIFWLYNISINLIHRKVNPYEQIYA